MIVEYTDLSRAVAVLLFFYLLGALLNIATGNELRVLEIPRIEVGEGGNFLIALLNGAIAGMQFIVDLLSLPFAVVMAVDFGIEPLNIIVKSTAFIVVAYTYLVVLKAVKDVLHPLH